LNWLTIAAVMQWHAEFIADTPCQQTLCPSLSELQIIDAFNSDYVFAATAAEARISFELRPTISCLCSSTFQSIYGRKLVLFRPKTKKNENEKFTFGRKRKWPKPSKIVIFGAENENEFRSVSTLSNLKTRSFRLYLCPKKFRCIFN